MSQAVTFLEHHDVEVPFLFFAQLPRKKKKKYNTLRSRALLWDERQHRGGKKGGEGWRSGSALLGKGWEDPRASGSILTPGCCRCFRGCSCGVWHHLRWLSQPLRGRDMGLSMGASSGLPPTASVPRSCGLTARKEPVRVFRGQRAHATSLATRAPGSVPAPIGPPAAAGPRGKLDSSGVSSPLLLLWRDTALKI